MSADDKITIASGSFFTAELMQWHLQNNRRSMPWKEEKDPYKIWLSEIILQQTRVAQGLPYYNRFIARYPTLFALAAAGDDEVMRLWEGLGYYSRCRNMLSAARTVIHERDGKFPDTYEGLLDMKGVGPYTAAAIGSFAFGLPLAVVDGNVYRVLSRFFGIDIPTDSPQGADYFARLAATLLDKARPGAYNQAIMDFGATICRPQTPRCSLCPFRTGCTARIKGTVARLPVRNKKKERRKRWFIYFWLKSEGKTYMQQRSAGDVWAGLYEPFLLEADHADQLNEATALQWIEEQWGMQAPEIHISAPQKQLLTHQQISVLYVYVALPNPQLVQGTGDWYTAAGMEALPKPIQIAQSLKQSSVQSRLL